jgi:hypothetical protein
VVLDSISFGGSKLCGIGLYKFWLVQIFWKWSVNFTVATFFGTGLYRFGGKF